MKANLNVVMLISGATLLVAMVISMPSWLDDSNDFQKSFVGEPLLSALGVILAINLASLAQLHLSLNKIEGQQNRRFLAGARNEIRSSARWMVGLFVLSIVFVAAKPLVGTNVRAVAAMNAVALFTLAFYLLIMADIIEAVFDLEPNIAEDDNTPTGAG